MENTSFSYEELNAHVGHNIAITKYGKDIEIECNTCRDTLARATTDKLEPMPVPLFESNGAACNMDEGCEACGS